MGKKVGNWSRRYNRLSQAEWEAVTLRPSHSIGSVPSVSERKLNYEITARFDDGLYKIVNDEWVLVQRYHKPKTVDLRHAFAFIAPENTKMEPKMTRFKRFMAVFAKFFNLCTLAAVLLICLFAIGMYLDEFFGIGSAIVAWIETV